MRIASLKIILRKLIRNKLNSSIIVGGLSIGLAVCILITLYVDNELSYDKHHADYQKVYRIVTTFKMGDEIQNLSLAPIILGTLLKDGYPEIKEVARVSEMGFKLNIKHKDKLFVQDGIREASHELLNVLSYTFLVGNPSDALMNENSIVLTKSLTLKLFGNISKAMGEQILLDGSPNTVTGVIEDLPKNSDLQFTALIAKPFTGDEELLDLEGHIYIKSNGCGSESISWILKDVVKRKYKELLEGEVKGMEILLKAQPLADIHFSEELLVDNPKGNKVNLYLFSLIAIIILILVSINYINLSMAMFSKQLYYMGMCKLAGAKKMQLIKNSISETILLTGGGFILAVVISVLLLPLLNNLTSKDIEFSSLLKASNLLIILGLFILVNIVVGLLPSLSLAKISTIEFIKQTNQLHFIHKLRKPLVIFQFAISIVMISGLLVFQNQLFFLKNKNLGYKHHNIVALELPVYDTTYLTKVPVLINELIQLPGIIDFSTGKGSSFFGANHRGEKMLFADEINGRYKQFAIHVIDVDEAFLDFMGIKLLNGRNFNTNSTEAQNENYIIINESYARAMELGEHPVGKKLRNGEQIIGLVKDFNFTPLLKKIEPACFRYKNTRPDIIYLKTSPENIAKVEGVWQKHMQGYPFVAKYLSDNYLQAYESEEKDLKIIKLFTLISVLITCIGLLGLLLFIADSRTKEIGIRKVNGAKNAEILMMLNKDLIKWVVIAFAIACPIAYYAMTKWLENFAYRTGLSWWVFVAAGVLVMTIALITVSWQSWKAATKNPVEALRYE